MRDERPPSFAAACLAAAGGHVLATVVVGVVALPFALVASTGLALNPDPSRAAVRLVVVWLCLLAAQLLLAAGIARFCLQLFDAGAVSYLRAFAAMLAGLVVSLLSALVLPPGAALPVLGYAWTGVLAAALLLANRPPERV